MDPLVFYLVCKSYDSGVRGALTVVGKEVFLLVTPFSVVLFVVMVSILIWAGAAQKEYIRLYRERINAEIPTPEETSRDFVEARWRYAEEPLEQNWGRVGAIIFKRQDDTVVEAARIKMWRRYLAMFLAFVLLMILSLAFRLL